MADRRRGQLERALAWRRNLDTCGLLHHDISDRAYRLLGALFQQSDWQTLTLVSTLDDMAAASGQTFATVRRAYADAESAGYLVRGQRRSEYVLTVPACIQCRPVENSSECAQVSTSDDHEVRTGEQEGPAKVLTEVLTNLRTGEQSLPSIQRTDIIMGSERPTSASLRTLADHDDDAPLIDEIRAIRPAWDAAGIRPRIRELGRDGLTPDQIRAAALAAARDARVTAPIAITWAQYRPLPSARARPTGPVCAICGRTHDTCRSLAVKTGDAHPWTPELEGIPA